MLKKSMLLLCLFVLFFQTHAFAIADYQRFDGVKKMTLVDEHYDGTGISRQYQLDNETMVYRYLEVPTEWQSSINQTDNPLLESKKRLAALYVAFDSNERLAELHNLFVDGYTFDVLTGDEIKNVFTEERILVNQFAREANYDELKKEFKDSPFPHLNYSELDPTFKDIYEVKKIPTTEKLLKDPIDSKKWFSIGGVLILVIGIAVLVTYTLRR